MHALHGTITPTEELSWRKRGKGSQLWRSLFISLIKRQSKRGLSLIERERVTLISRCLFAFQLRLGFVWQGSAGRLLAWKNFVERTSLDFGFDFGRKTALFEPLSYSNIESPHTKAVSSIKPFVHRRKVNKPFRPLSLSAFKGKRSTGAINFESVHFESFHLKCRFRILNSLACLRRIEQEDVRSEKRVQWYVASTTYSGSLYMITYMIAL